MSIHFLIVAAVPARPALGERPGPREIVAGAILAARAPAGPAAPDPRAGRGR
ncbi:MAG TPA: hypothetical protein VIG69_02410 [Candidatus Methylomirabilis sp.]|jgi:hypothetical protein